MVRTWVQTPLYLRERTPTDFLPVGVHPKELDLSFLQGVNFKTASSGLGLLQKSVELERENKQLRKEVLNPKLLLLEYKTST